MCMCGSGGCGSRGCGNRDVDSSKRRGIER